MVIRQESAKKLTENKNDNSLAITFEWKMLLEDYGDLRYQNNDGNKIIKK